MITCIKFPPIKQQIRQRHSTDAVVFLVDKIIPISFTNELINFKLKLELGGSFLTYKSQKCRSLVANFKGPEGEMSQQKLKMFPSATKDPAAYYFPCFTWRTFYWDFAIWLPQRAKMLHPNLIPDHWHMQSLQVELYADDSEMLHRSQGGISVQEERDFASQENRCRVKHDMSCELASLWINVHSVWKIDLINIINSPQRCRISLVISPHHLKWYTVCFFFFFLSQKNKYTPMYSTESGMSLKWMVSFWW